MSHRLSGGWRRPAGFLLFFSLLSAATHAAVPQELVLLTWEGYLDPDVAAEFEASHRARIRQVYFESDNERDLLLVQHAGTGFDLAMVDDVTVTAYQRKGWLRPLDEEQVPNLRHIDPALWDAYPQLKAVAAPYMQGTMGIIYRTDLAARPITSWMQLFRPAESLRGKIMMVNDPYDLLAAAMKALNQPMLSEQETHLARAEELLLAQKPFIFEYGYFDFGPESELVTGEVIAAQAFNGDYYSIQEYEENLAYVVPEEGGSLWVDSFVLLRASANPPLALRFLDFLNRPEIAARNAESIHYASCNAAARTHHSQDFLEDRIIHPPPSEPMRRSERYRMPSAVAAGRFAEIYYSVTE